MGRPKKDISTDTKNEADIIICKYRYKLEEEQQEFLRQNYVNFKGEGLVKLAQACFEDPLIDENSPEVNNIRSFIVRLRKGNECYFFKPSEIKYILENGEHYSPIELCRQLLPGEGVNLVTPSQTAAEVLKAQNIEYKGKSMHMSPRDINKYAPPATESKILARINEADINAKYHVNDLVKDSRKKACVSSLKRNMHSARFLAVASSLKDRTLQSLFETEFVRHTYDKPDLTAEESNDYISLCNEYVIAIMLTNQLSDLNDKLALAVGDDDNTRKYTTNLSDSRSAVAAEFNACQGRIQKLQSSLNVKRSDRLKLEGQANESLAKWIDLVTSEDGRRKLLRLQDARNLELENEIKRIDNFDQLIAEFAGLSVEEILKF